VSKVDRDDDWMSYGIIAQEVEEIDFDQLELDLDDCFTLPTGNSFSFNTINFSDPPSFNIDTEQEQLTFRDKAGHEFSVPFKTLEKLTILMDTIEQMEGTELGDLFKTNVLMHRLKGKS